MPDAELPTRMRADLTAARRAGDQPAVRALRSTLAAFANAEAPALDGRGPAPSAGLVDHPRLELTVDDRRRLLVREIDERSEALVDYEGAGRPGPADDLRAEIAVLRRYL